MHTSRTSMRASPTSIGRSSGAVSPDSGAYTRPLTPSVNIMHDSTPSPSGNQGDNNSRQFWVNRVKPLSTPSSPSKISSTLASSGMPESILAPGGWPPVSSPSDGRQRSLEKLGNGPEKDTNVARQFQSLSLERSALRDVPSFNLQQAQHRRAAAVQTMTLSSPRHHEGSRGRVSSDSEARSNPEPGRIDEGLPLLSPAGTPTVFPSISNPYNSPSSYLNLPPRDSSVPQVIAPPVVGIDPPNAGVEFQHSTLGVPPLNAIQRTVFPLGVQVEVPQPPFLGAAVAPPLHPEGYTLSQNIGLQHALGPSNHLIYHSSASHPNISYPYAAPRESNVSSVAMFYPDLNSAANPAPYFYPPAPNQSMMYQTPPLPVPNAVGRVERGNRKSHFASNEVHNVMPAQFSQTIPNGPYRNISLPTQMPFAAYPLGHAIDSSVNSLIPLRNGQQRAHTQSHRRGASDSRHRRVPSAVEQPSAHRPWSQTLEHFREFRFRPWSLKDVKGHIVEFSMDQQGSRFIQTALDESSAEERRAVFEEIHPQHTLGLITDVFGNYVVQKFIERGTTVQRNLIISVMESKMARLSSQTYGCRVVQKAIEHVTNEQQDHLIRELSRPIISVTKDSHGNHVIQKLIQRVNPERLPFLETYKHCTVELASHPYGCRVLQRCFECLSRVARSPLLDELVRHTPDLATDQFGNYVIQYVLDNGEPSERAAIINRMKGQALDLSRHKFASNVIEKAMFKASAQDRRDLIAEIMDSSTEGYSPIASMMKDSYANYVLQTALKTVDGPQREDLVDAVRFGLAATRRTTSQFNKNLASIELLITDNSTPSTMPAPPSKARAKSKAVRFTDRDALSQRC